MRLFATLWAIRDHDLRRPDLFEDQLVLFVGGLDDDRLDLHLPEMEGDQGCRRQILPEGDDHAIVLLDADRFHDLLIRSIGQDRLGGTVPHPLDRVFALVDGNDLEAVLIEFLNDIETEDAQPDDDHPLHGSYLPGD